MTSVKALVRGFFSTRHWPAPSATQLRGLGNSVNSRNKILATVAALNPARRAALVPWCVFTVTNPSRDKLYEPLTILPLIGILTSFHLIDSVIAPYFS